VRFAPDSTTLEACNSALFAVLLGAVLAQIMREPRAGPRDWPNAGHGCHPEPGVEPEDQYLIGSASWDQ
jgi:hypothetical protein